MTKKNKIARAFFIGFFGGALPIFFVFLIFHDRQADTKKNVSANNDFFSFFTSFPKVEISGENDFSAPPGKTTENFTFDGSAVIFPAGTSTKSGKPHLIELSDGDLYERYGGGRDSHPSNTPPAKDQRLQIDARVPVEISSKLKIYGVSTMTLGETESSTVSDYVKNYGIGGGIGLSYEISPHAELDFDYRRTLPLESKNDDPATESAGISIRLKF